MDLYIKKIQQPYGPHMHLYIKNIQQPEYQLTFFRRSVLNMSYQRLTSNPIQYLDLQANSITIVLG